VQVTAYGWQAVPDRGVVWSCNPLQNFGGSNHITGTAEPKVVKFCTRVGYINSDNRMPYHQQKGRGYGHVTVSKLCCWSWCSASRGFVSDSWATCWNYGQPQILAWQMGKFFPHASRPCPLVAKLCSANPGRVPPKHSTIDFPKIYAKWGLLPRKLFSHHLQNAA